MTTIPRLSSGTRFLIALRLGRKFLSSQSAPPTQSDNRPDGYSSRELSKRPIFPTKAKSLDTREAATFVDYVEAVCKGGNGGNGIISFLRIKNNAYAGPDGGNGGNGGHVIFKADSKVTDLSGVSSVITAESGKRGDEKCCDGKSGEHTYISVPVNTVFRPCSTRPSHTWKEPPVLRELFRHGDLFIAAKGGAGGHGNAFYLSNEVRKPMKAEVGAEGEVVEYSVEMRTMAAAGLVGFPNAGKSTFLRAISRARPRVSCYPFTTRNPHVGMVQYDDFEQIAVADIPGIMEGAHENTGVGFSFLKHLTRCECIFYILDYTLGDHHLQLSALREELELYAPNLLNKANVIIVNKMDRMVNKEEMSQIRGMFPTQYHVFFISAKYSEGLEEVLVYLRDRHEAYVLAEEERLKEAELHAML